MNGRKPAKKRAKATKAFSKGEKSKIKPAKGKKMRGSNCVGGTCYKF